MRTSGQRTAELPALDALGRFSIDLGGWGFTTCHLSTHRAFTPLQLSLDSEA